MNDIISKISRDGARETVPQNMGPLHCATLNNNYSVDPLESAGLGRIYNHVGRNMRIYHYMTYALEE